MLKKICFTFIILFLFSVSSAYACFWQKKEKPVPVYFYENVNKKDFFNKADEYVQHKKYNLDMYYPELGFMHIKNNDISILIKQFGNDVYLLVYPPENKAGKLESIHFFTEDITKYMKNISPNAYPVLDENLFKELQKDVRQIKETRKTAVPDDTYKSDVLYTFSVKRYVGYEKYKPSKFDKAKLKAQHKIDKEYYKQKEKAQNYFERQQKKEQKKTKKNSGL